MVLYREYSSAPHASPSRPAIAVGVDFSWRRKPALAPSMSVAKKAMRSTCIMLIDWMLKGCERYGDP